MCLNQKGVGCARIYSQALPFFIGSALFHADSSCLCGRVVSGISVSEKGSCI